MEANYYYFSVALQAQLGASWDVAAADAVFTVILGDPPKLLENCTDDELAMLSRSLEIDPAVAASMSREELIAALRGMRGSLSSANMTAAERLEMVDAVFTAILGDPPKSLESCSDDELAALARALGLDPAAVANMSREELIAAIKAQREALLVEAVLSSGIFGTEHHGACCTNGSGVRGDPGGSSEVVGELQRRRACGAGESARNRFCGVGQHE
jgi:hypothetical protein